MSITLLKPGGISTDTPGNIISLVNYNVITVGSYQTLFKDGAAYQITAGKTFYAFKVLFCPVSANGVIALYQGDNAVTNTTAPTNSVPKMPEFGAVTAFALAAFDVWFTVAAAKYLSVRATASANSAVMVLGYEV
jgi:hypothetical protein